MSRKSLKKKNSDILRLKILLEDKEVAEEELLIGANELAQILKEYSANVNETQKNKFDNLFFNNDLRKESIDKKSNSSATDIVLSDFNQQISSDINKKQHNVLPWVKKLYKLIIQRSHPDKYINFPIKEIKEKYARICMNAMSAIKSNDVGLILLCAYEVEIDVNEPDAAMYIINSSNSYKNQIEQMKNLIGFQWYHLPDDNRIYFLEKYLASLGFTFNKKKANESIKRTKRVRRKPGERPLKMKRNIS
jgi:hypothetical protein